LSRHEWQRRKVFSFTSLQGALLVPPLKKGKTVEEKYLQHDVYSTAWKIGKLKPN